VTFKVAIVKRGEDQPFWSKLVQTRADAERVAVKNQRLITRHGWEHMIMVEEVSCALEELR